MARYHYEYDFDDVTVSGVVGASSRAHAMLAVERLARNVEDPTPKSIRVWRERSIGFSAPLAPRVHDGTKTQTRRVIRGLKFEKGVLEDGRDAWTWHDSKFCSSFGYCAAVDPRNSNLLLASCPYGQVGDRLWVKEGYQITFLPDGDRPIGPLTPTNVSGYYLADGRSFNDVLLSHDEFEKLCARKDPMRATPGRFMYRSLSRTLLEISDVRVERIQDIGVTDCKAEGIEPGCPLCGKSLCREPQCKCRSFWKFGAKPGDGWRAPFRFTWDKLNEKRGFPWAKNPWVYVITFKRVEEGAR